MRSSASGCCSGHIMTGGYFTSPYVPYTDSGYWSWSSFSERLRIHSVCLWEAHWWQQVWSCWPPMCLNTASIWSCGPMKLSVRTDGLSLHKAGKAAIRQTVFLKVQMDRHCCGMDPCPFLCIYWVQIQEDCGSVNSGYLWDLTVFHCEGGRFQIKSVVECFIGSKR